jgi:hypothetical protein
MLNPARGLAQASPSSLRVEVISCVLEESAVDVSEMLAIARAELAPRELGQRQGDADGEPLLRVDACHDEHLILRSLKPKGVERRISLHDVPPEQRPRVAALALAEMVIVILTQPAAPPVAPAPATPPPAAPKPSEGAFPDWNPVESAPAQRPNTIGIGAETRLFTDSVGFAYGPHIDLSFRYLELSVMALFGHHRAELGEYRTGVVALSPSYPFFRSRSRAQVSLSIGADLGLTWGSAQPYQDSYGARNDAFAPFVSGFGQFALSGPLTSRTFARIALLGGYAKGVESRQQVEGSSQGSLQSTTQGPFASLALGLAWAM